MASCIKCGATLEEFDAGGDMICQNCESSVSGGHGGSANVQCQRCGMYLPSHELRMLNSRLYCSYCIMDVQDEDRRSKAGADGRGAGGEGGRSQGICERCGSSTDTLYSVQGRRLCSSCYAVGSGAGGAGGPSVVGLIIEKVASAFGVRQKPKIIPILPPGKLGMKVAGEKQAPRSNEEWAPEKFNLKKREMVSEKIGIRAAEPLSEGTKSEKKAAPEARKKFFSQHGEEKKD